MGDREKGGKGREREREMGREREREVYTSMNLILLSHILFFLVFLE